ncbi:MAG: Ig-like domain-containing protein [Burkholderiales bacterium]|nr:Ig-like domain-containing protein [Burkholderiales bacterium]
MFLLKAFSKIKYAIRLALVFLIPSIIIACGSSSSGSSAPAVSVDMMSPLNGASGVSTSEVVVLQFNQSVQNVNTTNVTLTKDTESGTAVILNNIIASNNNVYSFNASGLSQKTTYYVNIESGITNSAGNKITKTSFHFTTGDFTAPTVSMINPINNQTGVSKTPNISLQFSEAVNNVNATNVKLHEAGNQSAIAIGSITLGANHIYTFSPSSPLNDGATYYVEIMNGIKDAADNPIAPTRFIFTTGDFTVPVVSMSTPSNNSTGVSVSPSISFSFSEPVVGVTSQNVSLRLGSSVGAVQSIGNIVAGANNTYTFSPTNKLSESTVYFVTFNNNITDAYGNGLAITSFSFTTGDFTGPTVIMTNPGNNSNGVIGLPVISLQFSESVNNVVSNASVQLHRAGNNPTQVSIGNVTLGANNTYTFSPSAALQESTTYYVEVTNAITDVSNNQIATTRFIFTTGSDVNSPTATITSPANNATNVSMSPSITLRFSESVINVNAANIKLKDSSNNEVAIGNITLGANNIYTFSPSAVLEPESSYTVVITKGGIRDLAGNLLPESVNSTFKTGDYRSPTVSIVTPSNNAIGVSRSPVISLSFSESVINVTSPNVTLRVGSANGTVVPITPITPGANNTYSFSPVSILDEKSVYFVALTDGIKDNTVNQNPLGATSFSFTTGDFTAPTVAMTTPTNNAVGVAVNTQILVSFSESVQNVLSSVVLENISGAVIPATVSLVSGNDYKIVPNANLTSNTYFYVKFSSNIVDAFNNSLAPTTYHFATGTP